MSEKKVPSVFKKEDLFGKSRSTLITGVLRPDKKRIDIWYDETGTIRAAGPDTARDHRSEADIILDGAGFLAMPGLVNTPHDDTGMIPVAPDHICQISLTPFSEVKSRTLKTGSAHIPAFYPFLFWIFPFIEGFVVDQ